MSNSSKPEADIRSAALEEAAEHLDRLNESSGDAAAYDGREMYPHEAEREHAISYCAHAIRTLAAAPAAGVQVAPAGYVLVPVDPTPEMVNAPNTIIQAYGAKLIYQRMLAAAPAALSESAPSSEKIPEPGYSDSLADRVFNLPCNWKGDQALHSAILMGHTMACEQAYDLIMSEERAPSDALKFANIIVNGVLEGGDWDGGTVQELAESCGLLKQVLMRAPCSEACSCAENGAQFPAMCYRKTYRNADDLAGGASGSPPEPALPIRLMDHLTVLQEILQRGTVTIDKIHELGADGPAEEAWMLFYDEVLPLMNEYRATLAPEPALRDGATAFDFHAHLARQAAWSSNTFGPGPRTAGVCDHIRKELLEIEADPLDLKEWIDVVILALDGAWRCGGKPDEIINGIVAKQTKNEGRNWPDWRTADPTKAIEHDRTGEQVAIEAGSVGDDPEFNALLNQVNCEWTNSRESAQRQKFIAYLDSLLSAARKGAITKTQQHLVDVVRSFGAVSCAAYISTWHKPEAIEKAIAGQSGKDGEPE